MTTRSNVREEVKPPRRKKKELYSLYANSHDTDHLDELNYVSHNKVLSIHGLLMRKPLNYRFYCILHVDRIWKQMIKNQIQA